MRPASARQDEARVGLTQAPNDTPREGAHAARTDTPSSRRRPGPRGGARIPPQRPISTNTHLLKWPPFRHPRHQSGISPQTGNLHTVGPAKAGAPGAGHGNRLNARHRPTPIFPNGPPSVIPDTDRGSRRKPETYTPSPRRRPGPRGGAWKPPQRPISTNTHLLNWPPFRHPRHRSGISPQTGNLHTVAPAKAGAQGRGMETASAPDIDEHPPSEMAPLPSSPTPTGDLLPHPSRVIKIVRPTGRHRNLAFTQVRTE